MAPVILVALLVLATDSARAGSLQYNRDVRPILAENCFQCHGPDSAARKADLRLDQRDAAIEAGAIVPGKPGESELVARIFTSDADELMPPAETHKELKPAQRELLKRWIVEGAEYQPHWSFIAPQKPALPPVKQADWVRNPIDRFVLARLEQVGLKPAPEADRRTLARRLSLDLTGLPPDPKLVDEFVADQAPDAYEKLVDRLEAMPEWGEHRGRYWLDVARYGDTHGIHIDNFREIWSYRDWVIGALNRNMPFDQFTLEQLAGDLLPAATLDQRIASGFNRCNITTSEGGAIAEEYLVLYDRDRTETTSQVWLGLTAGCAVCHDHKFDPISQHEFYSLAAFFNNTTQAGMDGNVKDTPPIVVVPQAADRPRWDALGQQETHTNSQLGERRKKARPEFEKWLALDKRANPAELLPADRLQLLASLSDAKDHALGCMLNGKPEMIPISADPNWDTGYVAAKAFRYAKGTALAVKEAGDFEKDQAFSCGAWVKLSKPNQTGAVLARMDEKLEHRGWDLIVAGGRLQAHLIHKSGEDEMNMTTRDPISINKWHHLFMTYDGSGKAGGMKLYIDGQQPVTRPPANKLSKSIRTTAALTIAKRTHGAVLNDAALQDVRVYSRRISPEEVGRLMLTTRAAWLAEQPAGKLKPSERKELLDWWLPTLDKPYVELEKTMAKVRSEQNQLKSRGTIAHVMNEKTEAAMAYVLYRGEYDQRRDKVTPGTPAALPPMAAGLPRNRVGLARWLLASENPLTARVTVNRFWQEVFGTGLVRTSGDFGVTGELPTNPELLDWLAIEFRTGGWDVKRLFKLLVTSATYRQSAMATHDKLEKDPANRLCSRGPRFRMDGEMIRDYALAASGLLVHKLGGPSVKPYQPEGVWEAVAMIGSNTRNYEQDKGESLYRRSMYTFWKRSAPPASMDIFNAPSRETCTVRRERTDTPLQALVTLNDPQFIEAARHLAGQALLKADNGNPGRVQWIARRLLARDLNSAEQKVALATVETTLAYYRAHVDDAHKLITVGESAPPDQLDVPMLAAWTMVTNELLNLDEVLNK